MSDTVDNVLDAVSEAAASGADEPAEDVVVSEEVDQVEEPEPVASASETESAEPAVEEPAVEEAPVEAEEVAEPAPSEPSVSVSTQEVVQNVQEILSSTETNVTGDNSELEERVKVLEERLEKTLKILSRYYGRLNEI